MTIVAIEPATPERWADLERLFGPTGAYGHCWCVYFRRRAKDFTASVSCSPDERGDSNREELRRVTLGGKVPGLIAYEGNEPCGWVSVAPREDFIRLSRSRSLRPTDPAEPDVWSLVCFWLPPRRRRKGMGSQLLDGAIEHARANGGRVLEAYPVDTAGGRAPSAEVYTGTVRMFRKAGFACTTHPDSGRPIARLTLKAD
ncbi:GNAT family N-acetyltransferase [Streptomonospora litoralis]|uniref:Acetyltransferase (GNAT) family protein n=1 Tax=Streptomonospora litoralis TaxID=2498135 RepID=A0A4P6Q9R7_9ACTN|nr:GNAT family N-acetyltransferase [Streptomonospora litoralis]QBI56401.1 Acetyltransferase (GNAT) family protein [Streptomonospora litoralis]